MTEKANPSINRRAQAFKTAGAIAYGGSGDGYISPASSPTEISIQDDEIIESNLNAFEQTSSETSLDITINGGEAFVFGSWIAIDTATTVTLSADTSGQVVYVGWNKNGTDDVIVGTDTAFSDADGDADQKIELYSFDTGVDGVIGVDDRRSFDQINAESIEQSEGSGLDADTVDGLEADAFINESGDTMTGDLLLKTGNLLLEDNIRTTFGTDNDVSQLYDPTNDSFKIQDEVNNSDKLELERASGNMNITGTLTENSSL